MLGALFLIAVGGFAFGYTANPLVVILAMLVAKVYLTYSLFRYKKEAGDAWKHPSLWLDSKNLYHVALSIAFLVFSFLGFFATHLAHK